ncbi:Hypothetical predicted protein [Paramuricea clavata]|uniref:FP protein C-terminal domain-containing protein n=1 Tax=Paramuricea clavata TaxID=317549 RepID=A0A6S7HW16_PARCT|nr:Hypothetical predicted protein [Paramuricea clavata]
MADTVKSLRKANDALKEQLNEFAKEMLTMKAKIDKHGLPLQPSLADLKKQAKGLQYLSDEYDNIKSFKGSTEKELKCLNTKLTKLSIKTDKLAAQIDSIEQYSYNYNLKIMGVPQISQHETAEDTASLCMKLFTRIVATNISLQDIDIAHPNAIICKFTSRLAREKVLLRKKATRSITSPDLGLDLSTQIKYIGIFEHLTPRIQQLLYQAKCFQAENNYKFCWSKSSCILLRISDTSRIIKLQNMPDLEKLCLDSQDDDINPDHIFGKQQIRTRYYSPNNFKQLKSTPGGDDTEAGNYRPISLLPNFNKIFEKVIYKRIMSFVQTISAADLKEQAKGLQYLSDEYDNIKSFKGSTEKELKCLNTKLTKLIIKTDKLAAQIDSTEQYSYNYNLKIVGVPQISQHETAEDTASLCMKLFTRIVATNISLQDIDIAHPNAKLMYDVTNKLIPGNISDLFIFKLLMCTPILPDPQQLGLL